MTDLGGVRIIRATDSSPAARDRAFAAAAAATRHGLLGPIGAPMVILPVAKATAPAFKGLAQKLAEPAAPPATGRAAIRAARRSIGGYASVFNQPDTGGDLTVAPGAFRDVIASRHVFLFLNHPGDAGVRPSLAATSRGSLHLEEDSHGLWFEAALGDDAAGSDAYQRVLFGAVTGVSWGTDGGAEWMPRRQGGRLATRLAVWELSLLTPPHQPRFRSTWACPNIEARARRLLGPGGGPGQKLTVGLPPDPLRGPHV